VFNWQLERKVSITGKELNRDSVAYPCGIVANNYFDDEYKLYLLAGNDTELNIEIDENNIIWNKE